MAMDRIDFGSRSCIAIYSSSPLTEIFALPYESHLAGFGSKRDFIQGPIAIGGGRFGGIGVFAATD